MEQDGGTGHRLEKFGDDAGKIIWWNEVEEYDIDWESPGMWPAI